MAHFRIYENGGTFHVRVWRWWWPRWVALEHSHTDKVEYAEAFARGYAGVPGRCVKSLGSL